MSSRKPTNTGGNSEKRTAQIRAAQRAYRERKENHVKSLEDQVAALKVQVSLLSQPQPQDVVALIEKVAALEQSNMRLKEKVSELQEKSLSAGVVAGSCPDCADRNKGIAVAGGGCAPKSGKSLSPSPPQYQNQALLSTIKPAITATNSGGWGTTAPSFWIPQQPNNQPPLSYLSQTAQYHQQQPQNLHQNDQQQYHQHHQQYLQQVGMFLPSQEVSTASSIVSSTGSSTSVAISTAPVPEYGQPYYLPDSGGYGIIKTAVEMYGIPDYEYALKAIKELPSMKDERKSKHVEEMFSLFWSQVNCSKRTVLKKSIIKSAAVKYKILNGCSVLDRARVMEILDEVQLRNKLHVNHIYYNSSHMPTLSGADSMTASPRIPPLVKVPPQADAPFKEAIAGIPSLTNSSTDINELCALFWTQTRVRGPEREAIFFKMIDLFAKLLRDCVSEEDRTKFLLATEIGREINNYHVSDMFNSVQSME